MSHYNKWAGGGYYYSDWWKKKDKKDGKKSSPSSTPTPTSGPSHTSIPGSSGTSAYGGYGSYGGYSYGGYGYSGYGRDWDDYDDDEVVDYKEIYKSRYKSSLGYSSSKLTSAATWWAGGSYNYHSTSEDDIDKLKEFLLKATKEARDLIVILDFPFKVRIDYSFSMRPIQSGQRRIFVPTRILDEPEDEMPVDKKVSTFCGLAVHEAAHLKYTEVRVIDTFSKLLNKNYKKSESQFMKTMIMMIEDERIEDSLLKERPGYLEIIEFEKNYEYKRFLKSAESVSGDFQQFFINLYKLVRFPENVDMEILNKYQDLYEKIGLIIAPLPTSSKEVCIAAEKVYKTIKDTFDIENLPKNEADEFYKALQESVTAGTSGFEDLLYGLDTDLGEVPEGSVTNKITDRDSGSLLEELTDGTVVQGESKNTFFANVTGGNVEYMESLGRVKKYVPMIRKIIQGHDRNYNFNIFGCRSGILDTNKLAEAYQGVPQVYVRQGQVRTNKTTVCVLVDESGSMGWCEDIHSRISLAKDAAILLNEALRPVPGVDLYIYGHSADIAYTGATEINIYKEGNTANKYSLGNVEARCENRDGTAIYEVAKRIRKFTESPVLMFIISDGEPSACGYRGLEARKDTKDKIKKVEQMGFEVIGITIQSWRGASEMYPKNVDLSSDLSVLPHALGKLIKKSIIQNKKTTITTV